MATQISETILEDVLRRASNEERLALTQVVHPHALQPLAAVALVHALGLAAGHGVLNALRQKGVSYAELLSDAIGTLGIKDAPGYYQTGRLGLSIRAIEDTKSSTGLSEHARVDAVAQYLDELERKLLLRLMSTAYERATPAQRQAIDVNLRTALGASHDKSLKGLSTSAALLAIGNLGGFATYTAASTVLSTLSFGTLGFGAYAFASSAISVLLGPAGWLALGLAAAIKFGGPNKSLVVRLAATSALTAQRIKQQVQPHGLTD